MQPESHHSFQFPPSHSVRVDASGRIVVPAELREQCQILPGQQVVLEVERGHLRVRSYDQVLEELQEYFADAGPDGVLLSEELIRERRAAAAREFAEAEEPAGAHD